MLNCAVRQTMQVGFVSIYTTPDWTDVIPSETLDFLTSNHRQE